jgi:hypothetical protein
MSIYGWLKNLLYCSTLALCNLLHKHPNLSKKDSLYCHLKLLLTGDPPYDSFAIDPLDLLLQIYNGADGPSCSRIR